MKRQSVNYKLHAWRLKTMIILVIVCAAIGIISSSFENKNKVGSIERDAAKDALAERSGFAMFRYRGRDIHRNAWKCAEEIIFQLWGRA